MSVYNRQTEDNRYRINNTLQQQSVRTFVGVNVPINYTCMRV